MNRKPATPQSLEVVRASYQPTQAQMKEEFEVPVRGVTAYERMVALTRAMVRPVKLRRIDKPRKRR